MTANTSRPEMSTYALGDPVTINFIANGLKPSQSDLKLTVRIVNALDQPVDSMTIPVIANAKGAWKTTITPPQKRMGFYRVFASLSDGTTLPRASTRPAGYITYCIVPDPAKRKLYPESETFFGLQGGFNKHVNVLPYLGVRWVSEGYGWGAMEKDGPGSFSKKRQKAKAKGQNYPVRVWDWPTVSVDGKTKPWKVYRMPTFFYDLPKILDWAIVPGTMGTGTGAIKPEAEAAWGDYCRAAAKAFMEDHPDRQQRIYQITWEPVYPWGFKGTDEQLLRIYEIAYPAIHDADPQAVVVGPCMSSANVLDDTDKLFVKGLGKYLDGFSIHPYKAVPPETNGLLENCRNIKKMLFRHTGKNLPIFGTEQGWGTKGDPANEIKQAVGLIRCNLIMLGEGFNVNIAFYITDYYIENKPGYGFYYNLDPKTSFGSAQTSPKPIAPAYAAMTYLVEGHKSAGAIEWLGETALGYAYEMDDDIILALWDYGQEPSEVEIPVGTKNVEVFDWMGNSRKISTQNGSIKLMLNKTPTYVKGVSPKLWASGAEKLISTKSSRLATSPGNKIEIVGEISAYDGEPLNGKLVMESPFLSGQKNLQQDVTLGKGNKREFRFKLPISVTTPLGRYPVKLLIVVEDSVIAASGVMLDVQAPVSVGELLPVCRNGMGTGLQVILHELQDKPFKGYVGLRIFGIPQSQTDKKVPITLEPGETKKMCFDIKDIGLQPLRPYKAIVTVSSEEGFAFEQNFAFSFMTAHKAKRKIQIDGKFEDWAGISENLLKGPSTVVRTPEFHENDDDLWAKFRLAYDNKYLYAAFVVHDDVFMQNRKGFMTWLGDSVHFGFNMDHGKKESYTGNVLEDTMSKNRYSEIILSMTANGPESFRALSFNKEEYPVKRLDSSEVQLVVLKKDNNTVVYEVAIPWITIGAKGSPAPGSAIGICFNINDVDDSKQPDPSAIGIFSSMSLKDTSLFGMLILER